MKRTAELRLSKGCISHWNGLLDSQEVDYGERGFAALSTVAKWTVKFDDGCEADVRINTNEVEDCDLYAEVVLFDSDGRELAHTDPGYCLDGSWPLFVDGDEYVVDVKEKER